MDANSLAGWARGCQGFFVLFLATAGGAGRVAHTCRRLACVRLLRIADDGVIYMCPRKYATTTDHWNVKDSKFYWDNLPHTIVTLTDKKFVYREIGGHGTATLIRGTKEEVDPD